MGCRDCPRCCEAAIVGLVLTPFRLVIWGLTFWNVSLLRRRCPQCGHFLRGHQGGRRK